MLIAPLPYRDADRLVFVWLDQTAIGYPRGPLSGPDLRNLREGSTTLHRLRRHLGDGHGRADR